MRSLDTYSPTELGKFLSEAKLEGWKIAGVKSPSIVFDAQKTENYDRYDNELALYSKWAMVDRPVILTFDNGEKLAIKFTAGSHISATLYAEDEEVDMARDNSNHGKFTVTEFFTNLVGKTVREFKIRDVHSIDDVPGYVDDGIDENATDFILELMLFFTDDSYVSYEVEMDYMMFWYKEW